MKDYILGTYDHWAVRVPYCVTQILEGSSQRTSEANHYYQAFCSAAPTTSEAAVLPIELLL